MKPLGGRELVAIIFVTPCVGVWIETKYTDDDKVVL